MTNKLNWQLADTNDDTQLYLAVMRDINKYAPKGYIDVEISFVHFLVYPASLVMRQWAQMQPKKIGKYVFKFDWTKIDEVRTYMKEYIFLLCKFNHVFFAKTAFDEAFEIFCNAIGLKKEI